MSLVALAPPDVLRLCRGHWRRASQAH